MNFATFIAVGSVAALSVAVAGAESSSRSAGEARQVIALADSVRAPATAPALDELTGLYRASDGRTFFVEQEEQGLTIELPQSMGSTPLPLRAEAVANAFATSGAARVVFENDAAGRVTGLRFYTPSAAMIAAVKAPTPRGVVTIYDVG